MQPLIYISLIRQLDELSVENAILLINPSSSVGKGAFGLVHNAKSIVCSKENIGQTL